MWRRPPDPPRKPRPLARRRPACPRAPRTRSPQIPCNKLFELPGRPNVLYTLKDYSYDEAKGAAECRQDAGFMFKVRRRGANASAETGVARRTKPPPPPPGRPTHAAPGRPARAAPH